MKPAMKFMQYNYDNHIINLYIYKLVYTYLAKIVIGKSSACFN